MERRSGLLERVSWGEWEGGGGTNGREDRGERGGERSQLGSAAEGAECCSEVGEGFELAPRRRCHPVVVSGRSEARGERREHSVNKFPTWANFESRRDASSSPRRPSISPYCPQPHSQLIRTLTNEAVLSSHPNRLSTVRIRPFTTLYPFPLPLSSSSISSENLLKYPEYNAVVNADFCPAQPSASLPQKRSEREREKGTNLKQPHHLPHKLILIQRFHLPLVHFPPHPEPRFQRGGIEQPKRGFLLEAIRRRNSFDQSLLDRFLPRLLQQCRR